MLSAKGATDILAVGFNPRIKIEILNSAGPRANFEEDVFCQQDGEGIFFGFCEAYLPMFI
jgi:hypothetical protein